MTPSGNNDLKTRVTSKIRFLADQLASLDHYLPDTYAYLMNTLDQQKRLLAELEVQEHFTHIDEHEIPDGHPPS